jgi:gliding motility-associated-like protein
VFATHIVGGEFELTHISGTAYQLSLNLYFDAANGQPGANDPSIRVSIFEKGTNRRIGNEIFMPRISETFVNYTNIECTIGSLQTKKILYSLTINLNPTVFNHPQGYYVVWERCCRNNIITNIQFPADAGMSFYMEFPPVVVNGAPFINSSPKLFPPLSDYACLNTLFYYDFSGTDADGDSLVYSMEIPLQGHSAPPNNVAPMASPAPYPLVNWTAGLGINNQVPGNPAINIDRETGFLTVLPTRLGLFVFGVKCEEYRNGKKIGEVRRDFQLLVLNCPVNEKPAISLQKKDGNFYNEQEVITIKADDERCLAIYLSDGEPNQRLKVTAKPINFTANFPLLPITSGIVNQGGLIDSVKTRVCFPDCFTTEGKVYKMDLIVEDTGCSLPKKDTVRVSFIIEPYPNEPPVITTTSPTAVIEAFIGEELSFTVIGTDADNDQIKLTAKGQNFALTSQSIQFPEATGRGRVVSNFKWPLDCKATGAESYKIDFIATTTRCDRTEEVITTVEVRPKFLNTPPELSMEPTTTGYTVVIGTPLHIDLFGTDADNHRITIKAEGVGFDLEEFGMRCPTVTNEGKVQTAFDWTPDCRANNREELQVIFTLSESNCAPAPPKRITLSLRLPQPDVAEFIPANIFTPNGDNYNDYFEMPNLPPDYCETVFDRIQVFNRWGAKVYESKDRSFKWDGSNMSEGVYYYLIDYSDRQFKGYVTIVR